jgi:hypothetical protein
MMRTSREWECGEWTFVELINSHSEAPPIYGFYIKDNTGKYSELYASLDEAMVSAVGEKYTGRRMAGGAGTDTAAGWFMHMIGARQ